MAAYYYSELESAYSRLDIEETFSENVFIDSCHVRFVEEGVGTS